MDQIPFKVWFSKYALASGIAECLVTLYTAYDGVTKYYDVEPGQPLRGIHSIQDAFRTREEAVMDAEERRTKKIASLEKQISKLKKLKF